MEEVELNVSVESLKVNGEAASGRGTEEGALRKGPRERSQSEQAGGGQAGASRARSRLGGARAHGGHWEDEGLASEGSPGGRADRVNRVQHREKRGRGEMPHRPKHS